MNKEIPAKIQGFTPLIDSLVDQFGITTAAVFGKVWRYTQMKDGKCTASQDRLAKELNIGERSLRDHLGKLVAAGYLRCEPHQGECNTYYDTGKVQSEVYIGFGEPRQNMPDTPAKNAGLPRQKMPTKIEDKIQQDTQVFTEKENQQIDQKIKDMVEYSKKAKARTDTLLPEQWHEFGKAFTDATGIVYLPSQQSKWIGAFEVWHNIGVTIEDIKDAAERLAGVTIYSPMSLTNTLNATVAERKRRADNDPYKNFNWIE